MSKSATNKKRSAALKKSKGGKSECAVNLGRKGGLATKRAKKGIFSPAYKKKMKSKKK